MSKNTYEIVTRQRVGIPVAEEGRGGRPGREDLRGFGKAPRRQPQAAGRAAGENSARKTRVRAHPSRRTCVQHGPWGGRRETGAATPASPRMGASPGTSGALLSSLGCTSSSFAGSLAPGASSGPGPAPTAACPAGPRRAGQESGALRSAFGSL